MQQQFELNNQLEGHYDKLFADNFDIKNEYDKDDIRSNFFSPEVVADLLR